MQRIKSELLIEKINNLRKSNVSVFQTNYFFNELEKEIIFAENKTSLIFLKREKNFYKLFYCTINFSDLEKLLINLPKKEIYLEIISKTEIDTDAYSLITKYFEYKTTYQKLYKKLQVTENVTMPICKIDVDLIFDKLYSTFDIRFEHLMDKTEFVELASQGKVLTVYENNDLKSFLIYKQQGTKAYLNQIANYGSKNNLITLWELFYQTLNANGIKYLDLWYDQQNKKAENMYNIEQFQPLNMFNYCFEKLS